MNQRRAKILRRAAEILATDRAGLKRKVYSYNRSTVQYPKGSARQLYQIFKRSHDKSLYKKLQRTVELNPREIRGGTEPSAPIQTGGQS